MFAALPSRPGQVLRRAFRQAAAGIGNDQPHPFEATIDQVAQKGGPAGFVLLGTLADTQNLPKTFGIDGAGHQQRDIADLAGPCALHDDAVEIETDAHLRCAGSAKPLSWRRSSC